MDEEQQNNLLMRDSLPAVMQDDSNDFSAEENNIAKQQAEIEKLIDNDLNVIRTLVELNVLTREQGHNLIKQVIKNSYNSITKAQNTNANTEFDKVKAFEEFAVENPDFFKKSGREDVLSYLKNSKTRFDKDELSQISKLIEKIENCAVDGYLKKLEYGKTLNDENAIAKQRLATNAQAQGSADILKKVFTRAEIGKMSGDEFTKYEPAIMEALRKGLIR